jgi:hypothetical protein
MLFSVAVHQPVSERLELGMLPGTATSDELWFLRRLESMKLICSYTEVHMERKTVRTVSASPASLAPPISWFTFLSSFQMLTYAPVF